MALMTLTMVLVAYAVALLLDWLIVLVAIRALTQRWHVPIFAEFDQAGRPLVDRTLAFVGGTWNRVMPTRPIRGTRRLALASFVLCVCRLVLAAAVGGVKVVGVTAA